MFSSYLFLLLNARSRTIIQTHIYIFLNLLLTCKNSLNLHLFIFLSQVPTIISQMPETSTEFILFHFSLAKNVYTHTPAEICTHLILNTLIFRKATGSYLCEIAVVEGNQTFLT